MREIFNTKRKLKQWLSDSETRVVALEQQVAELSKQVAELSKRTLSQMTTKTEEPVPYAQVIDEWLNGAEGER